MSNRTLSMRVWSYSVFLQDPAGDTPLHNAILLGSNEIIDAILENGSRFNFYTMNETHMNVLQLAAGKGNA